MIAINRSEKQLIWSSSTMTQKPYANTRMARFIETRILELRPKKTQSEIASAAGYANVNMLAMLKSGASKVPLDRVLGLAQALECDPRHLFLLAFEQIAGSTTARAIEDIFGTVVTRNELAWLEEIRRASGGNDPALTARSRTTLRAVFGQ
jgi:hypothetical protein